MPVPLLNQLAPGFKGPAVINDSFENISITDYRGQYLILIFYPMDFTFVCPTEIIAFSERADQFKSIKTSIVGISTDSEFTHLAWTNTPRQQGGVDKLNFPLLSDKSMKISRDYGVLDEDTGVAYRGLFIIDPKGMLRQVTINDLSVGRSVDEALRLVQAIQFTDEHGDVCPVNWVPGKSAITPTVIGSQKFLNPEKFSV
ncbi:unnamed protein product [Brassicogethes aeneus]|uniref:thioredoxin-dependent peroxiredoxin n=1 Tax=Brassicogethes aeneus TaxID=1431903 RepID=A0A9P0BJD2_BRAAE|nr:unnamed protein product [Brassicogethes aeneus]